MLFVLDRRKTPLMPCSEKRARLLQRNDGYHYTYTLQERRFLPGINAEVSAPTI